MFTSKRPTCAGRTLDLPRKDRDIRYLRSLGNSDIADFVTPDAARQLEADLAAAGKDVEITIFEGADHAFFNDTRHEVYHATYAEQCWSRMVSFFNQHLQKGAQ